MGTNYYAHLDVCSHCQRASEVIHIGKQSSGWAFNFHGTDSIRSWEDWKIDLRKPTTKILDEYGQVISYEDFKEVVSSQKNSGTNHYYYCMEKHPEATRNMWLDPEDFCFSEGEFC